MHEQQPISQMPAGLDPSFLNRLTEQLEGGANAKAIYGDPIEREGITIIPVARARWGIGGGAGTQPEQKGTGTGGGGGLIVSPAGFIEICEGSAKFRAIRSPLWSLGLVLGGVALLLSGLKTAQVVLLAAGGPQADRRRLLRRRKRR